MRCAYVPLYRGQKLECANGARGFDIEDRRRPAVLSATARIENRGRRLDDRERFLQAGIPRITDGICRGSAEAAEREFGRKRGIRTRRASHDEPRVLRQG